MPYLELYMQRILFRISMVFVPINLYLVKILIFLSVLKDKLPALGTISEVVEQNLNAMYCARQALITSEASERIHKALRYNVTSSADAIFVTGNSVCYKRTMSNGRDQER